jgi:hypothetical protein
VITPSSLNFLPPSLQLHTIDIIETKCQTKVAKGYLGLQESLQITWLRCCPTLIGNSTSRLSTEGQDLQEEKSQEWTISCKFIAREKTNKSERQAGHLNPYSGWKKTKFWLEVPSAQKEHQPQIKPNNQQKPVKEQDSENSAETGHESESHPCKEYLR